MAHLHLILYVAAFILFTLSALNVPSPRVNVESAGLACLALTLIV